MSEELVTSREIVKQTDFGFGVDAMAGPAGPPRALSRLWHIRSLRMTFVMGGNSRAGSRQAGRFFTTLPSEKSSKMLMVFN